jgi:LCP family protein required for cell wall assembly
LRDGELQVTATTPEHSLDPRSSLAAFLSFVFPGLGQAYNGQRQLAWVLAVPILLLVAIGALALTAASSGVLSRLLDSGFLGGLIVLDLALLGWRLLAIAQAHGWRAPISPRHWTGWVTGLLLVVTLGMHALPAYWAVKAIDTLGAVAREGSDGSRGGGSFGRMPGTTPLPEPSDQPNVRLGERVNILLVGIDALPHREGDRLTDTMLVVSLDPDGRSAMISIPRDVYGTPLADGRVYNAKLNSLLEYANNRPEEFPAGGVGALKGAVGELLGIKIHYFAAINLLGFKQAVDAIGGVDIVNERDIRDPTYFNEFGEHEGFRLSAGPHHLDGHTALGYVRSRKGEGDNDFTRAERQQQLLAAVREKLTAGNLVLSLPGLLDAVKNTISTDVPEERFPALAVAIQESDVGKLERIVLQPPEYMTADPFSPAGYILIPNLPAIRAVVADMVGGQTTAGSDNLAGS